MIRSNEVRIGNWIMDTNPNGDGIHQVSEIEYKYKPCENIVGIPLTPEILEKCGFSRMMHADGIWIIDISPSLYLEWREDEPIARLVTDDTGKYLNFPNIPKHLHQLQNLYFALTGEELNYQP